MHDDDNDDDDDDDGGGDGGGVAQHGGHAPAHRLTKTCTLRLYWKYAIFSKWDFQRKKIIHINKL